MNRLIWNNYKKYIKEKALDSSESEAVEAVEDTSNVGGSATLKGNEKKYLKENLEIVINFYEGEIIGIDLPEKIEFEVVETTEATKGNTTNNALKDATIETGYVVKVPMFISQGEHIIISTKDGKYSSRA